MGGTSGRGGMWSSKLLIKHLTIIYFQINYTVIDWIEQTFLAFNLSGANLVISVAT